MLYVYAYSIDITQINTFDMSITTILNYKKYKSHLKFLLEGQITVSLYDK